MKVAFSKFLIVAGLLLAITFTLSCSSDEGESNLPPLTPSSDSSAEQKVFCKQNSGACLEMSLSTCMELVSAGAAQIVSNCNEPPPLPYSSSQQGQPSISSSSQGTGRLPCGSSDYNPISQFCYNNTTVYALCGGNNGAEYNPTTQLCQNNAVVNGWRDISGFETPSTAAWTWFNEAGVTASITKSNLQGVEFSAVSGSSTNNADMWKVQLAQKNHNIKVGDCYYVGMQGRTTTGTRTLNFGFQEDGGSYDNYGADDFTFSTTLSIIEKYFYISKADQNAVFYLNSGLNSSGVLAISALLVEKEYSNTTQSLCESLN